MSVFKKTAKQIEATIILGSQIAKEILLYGGSRSGKTFLIIRSIIIRACKTKSRHITFRNKFNHAKTSIWLDTLPKVMAICFPNLSHKMIKSDYYMLLPNGSEYWIAGLDDEVRVEKVLGKEYSTIHFNEISQIDYKSVSVAKTRLAEKNSLSKKVYYDCNPPSKAHWCYWLFIKKLDPENNIPLSQPEKLDSFLMNPADNLENIDPDYLDMLNELPEKDKNRFLYGLFNDCNDGVVYYSFIREKHVKENLQRIQGTLFIGMDFNVNPMTAIICQVIENNIIILDELFLEGNSDTFKMCDALKRKGYIGTVIPDSTGRNRKTSGKTDFQILEDNGFTIEWTRNPYVVDRVNNINRLFTADKIIVDSKCKKLINDLEKVSWKNGDLDEGKEKMLTHISDCLGYAAWKLYPYEKRINRMTIGKQV
jgi:PBSX family phage terminase large subunit